MNDFSHLDKQNKPTMVDVSDKAVTQRTATAEAILALPPEVANSLVDGDIQSKKGPVFQTAIIAGSMGAKKTSELIPFCHPIGMDGCTFDINTDDPARVVISCTCKVTHKTGIEMEALTGASIAALTVYDMCKALSHDMVIESVRLISKTGGKTDI